jgi:tetratricopeptide (TPR) repeat protein
MLNAFCPRWSVSLRGLLTCILLVAGLDLCVGRVEAGVQWSSRLDEAGRLAATSGKDLFILFTGTEWCAACIEFEKAVLSQPEFMRGSEPFVFVKLEFPMSFSDLPTSLREDYIAWRDRYGIQVFPTVLLADANGRPYALTGHIGFKVGEYVRHLGKLRQARMKRDESLSNAAKAKGIERARHLDAALSAVQEAFDKRYAEIPGDMMVRFYREEINQILVLDPANAGGLRDKYRRILDVEAGRDRVSDIYARFDVAMKEGGAKAAIKLVEIELERASSEDLRKRLRTTRLFYLEWGDRFEEAMAYATELVKDDSYSQQEKRRIQTRLAFNLSRLGRVDEAVAVYNRLIVEVASDSSDKWSLLRTKAQMLTAAGRLLEAMETWEAARKCAKSGTSHWLDTEIFRSRLLALLDRDTESIAGFDSALDSKSLTLLDRAALLAEKALILSKAGRQSEAGAVILSAEAILDGMKKESASDFATKNVRDRLRVAKDDTRRGSKKAVPPD